MAKHTLILGRRSNLSRALLSGMPNETLLASDELAQLPERLQKLGDCDLIYNIYQKSTLLHHINDPEVYAKYGFSSLATFVSLCLENQRYIRTILFTSSSAVYGNNAYAAEVDKTDIKNVYASLKLASELFLKEHFRNTNIRLVIPRVFNMYGGNDEFSVVSKLAAAALEGHEINVNNNGSPVRDFIHIDDVVSIYRRLLQSSCEGVINVGTGVGVSVAQLIKSAEGIFGCRLAVIPNHREEIERSVASTELLTKYIGAYSFKTVDEYYRDYFALALHKSAKGKP